MMATVDTAAGLPNIGETHIHQYAFKRWYMPFPTLHVRRWPFEIFIF